MILIIFLFGFAMGMFFFFILMWGYDLFFKKRRYTKIEYPATDVELQKLKETQDQLWRSAHGPLINTSR